MATVRVTTTAEATDELGKHIATVSHSSESSFHGGNRFLATYTRGACQANEHAINNMLVAQFGQLEDYVEVPRRTEL